MPAWRARWLRRRDLRAGIASDAGSTAAVDDLRPEQLAAKARVLLRLLAAQAVVHVQRRDAVAELPQHVPQAGRIGAAGDEAGHLRSGLDQLELADKGLDALSKVRWLHPLIVASKSAGLRPARSVRDERGT